MNKRNQFGPRTLHTLKQILDRDPNKLKHLKLVHCELVFPHLSEQLCKFLREEGCNLESLALVGMKLTEKGLNFLARAI